MDEEGMKFNAHRGRISYEMDGKSRSYYPDFYVHDWECYVDVKAKYFADLQEKKFKAIRKSNPKLKLKILLKEDMLKLGVSF